MCGTVRNDKRIRKRAVRGFHVSNASRLLPFPPTAARTFPARLPSAPRQCEREGLLYFFFFKECFPRVGMTVGELITSMHYPLPPVNDFLGPGTGPQKNPTKRCAENQKLYIFPPELGIPGVFLFCRWIISEILLFHYENYRVPGKAAPSFSAPRWCVRGE